MDAYRVEEITRYAASAPRKPAKVIMELLENRREIQATVVRLIGERDEARRANERLRSALQACDCEYCLLDEERAEALAAASPARTREGNEGD